MPLKPCSRKNDDIERAVVGDEHAGAIYSPDMQFRYVMWRIWNAQNLCPNYLAFIGLNPSTATELELDNTTRRCKNFALQWKFDGFVMLNAYAYRATDPRAMKAHPQPIGPNNDYYIRACCLKSSGTAMVVAAWGTHIADERARDIRQNLADVQLFHMGLTKAGHPRHPLYLASNSIASPLL